MTYVTVCVYNTSQILVYAIKYERFRKLEQSIFFSQIGNESRFYGRMLTIFIPPFYGFDCDVQRTVFILTIHLNFHINGL